MGNVSIRWVECAASTNSMLAAEAGTSPHGTVIAARRQTAGRGQRGNIWEAEPGMNLTFSMLLRPKAIDAASQFELSMIAALAVRDCLAGHAAPTGGFSVKWPNDIYFGDKKICGILIENSLTGHRIDRSIVGIGINVNQRHFTSDAPNPVSLVQIIGRETSLERLLEEVCSSIVSRIDSYESSPDPAMLTEEYKSALWRSDGFHRWTDCRTKEPFVAEIADVAADGILTLRLADGNLRRYAFKEVAAML